MRQTFTRRVLSLFLCMALLTAMFVVGSTTAFAESDTYVPYRYTLLANVPINDEAQSDAAYIHANSGVSAIAGQRWCDDAQELIYKFDLGSDNNLVVDVELHGNYVLEAAVNPDGPWTMIADYGVIGGGERINSHENGAWYRVHFAKLGLTGQTGYIRLSNVGKSGGWGGCIYNMNLYESSVYTPVVYPSNKTYLYTEVASIPVNDEAKSDASYIHTFNGNDTLIANCRFCDGTQELIYQYDLSKYTDLVVELTVGGNYVLEASNTPDGPWQTIAHYGIVANGVRVSTNTENMANYKVHFSLLGITEGTGYIRLTDVDQNGSYGGAVWGIKLYEASVYSQEDYPGSEAYFYDLIANIPVNTDTQADAAYIHTFPEGGSGISGQRYSDNTQKLIYQFDLADYNDLVVEPTVAGNYVLEASNSPDGPWTLIADYGVINGGERIDNCDNQAAYKIHFSYMGITEGIGYVRLGCVGNTGGWGGNIFALKLYEATDFGGKELHEMVIDAINAIDMANIAPANAEDKLVAIQTAQSAYDQWRSANPDADDSIITNLADLKGAMDEWYDFYDSYRSITLEEYTPEELLAMADETSVKPSGAESLAGVLHSASGKLYEDITSPVNRKEYTYTGVGEILVNDVADSDEDADAPYIYHNTSEDWLPNERFCDNDEELIYQFDLTKYTDLAVQADLGANYVLEASSSPDGGWIKVADYSEISLTRATNANNRAEYMVHFSKLGITGDTGYIRLTNVDRSGGWGGAIFGMKLYDTVAESIPAVSPGDELELQLDIDASAGTESTLLTVSALNGEYGINLSVNAADYLALEEKTNAEYGYTYRTVMGSVELPFKAESEGIVQALKEAGFTITLDSAVVGTKVYRVALVNKSTQETLVELTGEELLDAAASASAPSAYNLTPSAYTAFDNVYALRSPDGSGWYTVNYLRTRHLDELGRPLFHAGDEIECVIHAFFEGTDTVDLPEGDNSLRWVVLWQDGIDIGRTHDVSIISGMEYNEAELMSDENYNGDFYKEFAYSFVIPEDEESVAKVQSRGFDIMVGTHLDKNSNPLIVYSVSMINLTTGQTIIEADAEDLRNGAYENTREEITDGTVGGLYAPYRENYGPSTLLQTTPEELEAGYYSYNFQIATQRNAAGEKAILSVVDEAGSVLARRTITADSSGRFDPYTMRFYLENTTKVSCKVELTNGADVYLRRITLEQLLTQAEYNLKEVILSIDALPAVDELTVSDERTVSNVRRMYDRLSEEQQAQVTNYSLLTAAEEKLAQLLKEAADAVIALINALPSSVTLENAEAVSQARAAYNKLTNSAQGLIDSDILTKLNNAESTINQLKADRDAADKVIECINALPEKCTVADATNVKKASDAYEALTDAQKALVDAATKAKLDQALLDSRGDYGDVNSDGSINASDALLVLQHSVKLTTLDATQQILADVTDDGNINASDALAILQHSVGLIDSFEVEK